MRHIRVLAMCLALGVLACAAGAQDADLRRLATLDAGRAWEAVGRLDIGGRGFCTGALIAPDLVLTAAHCLYDPDTGARIDHTDVEFRAGWRNGRAAAYRMVTRAVVHPDYDYGAEVSSDRVRHDLALLELRWPIRNGAITPFATDDSPARGQDVAVVSYAHDRIDAPSLQEACRVLARHQSMLVMTCDVDFGSSGAPVLALESDGPRIVSVISAKAELAGQRVALGVRLDGMVATLLAELAAGHGTTIDTAAQAGQRITVQADRHSTGAKFVRP